MVWLQSRQGQPRLEGLLRLCLVTATTPNVDDRVLKTCRKFREAMTVPKDDHPKILPSILQACRPLLFYKLPPTQVGPAPTAKNIKSQYQPHARMGSTYCTARVDPNRLRTKRQSECENPAFRPRTGHKRMLCFRPY